MKKFQTRVVRFTKDQDRVPQISLEGCKSLSDLTKRLHSEAARMKRMAEEMPFMSVIQRRQMNGEASAYLRVAEMIRKLEVNKIVDRAGRTIAFRHLRTKIPPVVSGVIEAANNLAKGL